MKACRSRVTNTKQKLVEIMKKKNPRKGRKKANSNKLE